MRFRLKTLLLIMAIFAIAMAVYSRKPDSLDGVRGVGNIQSNLRFGHIFLFNEQASQTSVHQVLSLLPERGQISFFDSAHPQISEPGAYVTYRRVANDEFFVRFANEGWKSHWFVLSEDEAVAYLWDCHDDNTAVRNVGYLRGGMHLVEKPLPLVGDVNHDASYRFPIYVRERIKNAM